MAKALVIVESPTKARTLDRFLGSKYKVIASQGHVMDLPASQFGVDLENNFAPKYIVIFKKRSLVKELKATAAKFKELYLATDPDREGEAISAHLATVLGKDKKIYRAVFHEITPEAVKHAFEHPRQVDVHKVEAQQARRILDRILGYSLSPLLWKKVGSGLSAGRVQSVALRLIVDREREIRAFTPQEYWEIIAVLEKDKQLFTASLETVDGKKAELKEGETSHKLVEELIPTMVPLGTVVRVLGNLLKEGIPIRDLRSILEAISDQASNSKDPELLTEYARQALARTITKQYQASDGSLQVITLDPRLDRSLADQVAALPPGAALQLDPTVSHKLLTGIKQAAERVAARGQQPIIICSQAVRRHLRRHSDRILHSVPVMGFNEVDSFVRLQSLDTVRVDFELAQSS